ncbi:hypothetical protein D9619_004418 [Psilocybe cf. subviscida]|uniref:PX domain-containing protein n=1 Tax=Psilocybe cf. subviscida TaxID=2480587 RepID=A0A8H5F7Q5_9AGAR|nr:hypothetical protein D9619_004418 [Psilocybe cf. subviscida]
MLLGEQNASHVAGDNNPSANYKRAVMRAPPSRFMVEFLPTTKTNGAYHHGMHISPAITSDSASVSTRSSGVEYDIYRRWEDFLWFQDILEQEYTRAAREKKTRLQQGKGVKGFNGMYKQDMASSWESLPPGPDPNAVAQDIHTYLPTLTKKGTLFRASQATIDGRQKEITNLIETLFSQNMPALIQEIRESAVVTDFFALWRRDYDHMDRTPKYERNSVTSSVFSSYFSESTTSLATRSSRSSRSSTSNDTINPRSNPPTPAKSLSARSRVYTNERPRSISSSSDITETTRYPQSRRSSGGSVDTLEPMQNRRRRPVSSASSDSSMSVQSDGSSDSSSASVTSPSIAEEAPYVFGHNPHLSNDRPHSVLEVLPEERDMLSKTSGCPAVLPRRSRVSPNERRANRMTQVMCAPPTTARPVSRVRESWQTVTSMDSRADQIMEGLGFSLPNPIKDNKFRQSMASISTFMTTDSADAIIRRDGSDAHYDADADADDTRTLSSVPRSSTALTLSDFEIYSECDEEDDVFSTNDTASMLDRRSFLDARSILEGFPRPTSYLPESHRSTTSTDNYSDRAETPTGYQYLQSLRINNSADSAELPPSPTGTTFSDSTFDGPPSPTSTVFTSFTGYSACTTSSSLSPGGLSLKVAYNSTIILLRVTREISLAEMRHRLYNKFVGQEGVPLDREFGLAFAANSPLSPVKERTRKVSAMSAKSDGSDGSTTTTATTNADLQPITSEAQWRQIVSTFSGGKMSLRVTDAS